MTTTRPASPRPTSGRRRPSGTEGGRRRRRRIPRWLWWLAVVPALLVAMALAGVMTVLFISLPLPAEPNGPAILLDAQGTEFARLDSEITREDVDLTTLQQHTIDAVVAAEDGDFYTHAGVDPAGVVRAIVANIRDGEVSQGGSTITQQYIKVASGNNAQTVWRKLTEAALALKLERTHSKAEILQMYLSTVYFGRGAYGIEAAARAFYGVDAAELTLPQSAVLAGVLPAPSVYDPLVDNEASHQRYRYVLGRMVEAGSLEAPTRDALLSQQPPTLARRGAVRDDAPWFTDVVRRELESLGLADGAGLTVQTSLNLGVQRHAEDAYRQAFGPTEATGALVSVEPSTGALLALVGGEDYRTDQLNLALTQRQPGSTFKVVALAAWAEEGRAVDDQIRSPSTVTVDDGQGSDWTVSNYGGRDLGNLSVREATWRSSNTVYAQMAADLGADRVATMADRLVGTPGAYQPFASLVLGAQETSPMAMAGLYATLANNGVRQTPHAVVQVWRGEEILYSAPTEGQRVLGEDAAASVTDVLRGVITNGTGQGAAIGRPAAGKTGTTQDYGDAWFAGYTPQVATVVWMGNRDNRAALPGDETGGGLPATTWARFMTAVHEGLEVRDFPTPPVIAPISRVTEPPATEATATPTPTATATPSETPTAAATSDAAGRPTVAPEPAGSTPATGGGTAPAPVPPPAPAPQQSARPQVTSPPPPTAEPTAGAVPGTGSGSQPTAAPEAPPEPDQAQAPAATTPRGDGQDGSAPDSAG